MMQPHFESVKDRETFWQQHIDRWSRSNLSGAAYCQQHDLVYHQFSYWRRKLTQDTSLPVVQPTGFSQVVLHPPQCTTGLCLHLPDGLQIHGIDTTNVPVVHQLLTEL